MSETQSFEIGQKVTNARGAWVQLCIAQHPSNFYHVYYFKHWAPDFDSSITETESSSHIDRARIEKRMRGWLANR